MRTNRKKSLRSLALLVALIQILSLFTLGVGAAWLEADGRLVKRSALLWARAVSNDDAAKRQPYYMLFDRNSGDNLSFAEKFYGGFKVCNPFGEDTA